MRPASAASAGSAALAVLALLLALVAGTAAPAAAAPVTATRGTTSITLPAEVVRTLGRHGIAAVAVGGTTSLSRGALTLSLPVTAASVDLDTFTGSVTHSGSLVVGRLGAPRLVRLSSLALDLETQVVSARVGRATTPVPLFDLVAGDLQVTQEETRLELAGFGVRLSTEGAAALNTGLRTRAFSAGQELGTATTVLAL